MLDVLVLTTGTHPCLLDEMDGVQGELLDGFATHALPTALGFFCLEAGLGFLGVLELRLPGVPITSTRLVPVYI